MKDKKPIELQLPKCNRCKSVLEPEFTTEQEELDATEQEEGDTTEQEEGDEAKPQFLIMFGRCDKCKVITVSNLIETKDIPGGEELK